MSSHDRDFKSKFKTGAEVLQSLFSNRQGPMGDQYLRWKLWMTWKEVVGPTTAEFCEPVAYHQGVLWLWVKNAAWLTQMNFMADSLRNAINQKFEQNMVREIRLTTDRKNVPRQHDEAFKESLKQFLKK